MRRLRLKPLGHDAQRSELDRVLSMSLHERAGGVSRPACQRRTAALMSPDGKALPLSRPSRRVKSIRHCDEMTWGALLFGRHLWALAEQRDARNSAASARAANAWPTSLSRPTNGVADSLTVSTRHRTPATSLPGRYPTPPPFASNPSSRLTPVLLVVGGRRGALTNPYRVPSRRIPPCPMSRGGSTKCSAHQSCAWR